MGTSMASESRLLKVASDMDALLSEVILLQQGYVAIACPVCEQPCCKRVGLLFDEKDVIFAKVSGRHGVPTGKRKGQKGCPFLSSTGCLLTPKERPFACHRYLCDELKEKMTEQDPELVNRLTMTFRTLEALRAELWKQYLIARATPRRDLECGGLRGTRQA